MIPIFYQEEFIKSVHEDILGKGFFIKQSFSSLEFLKEFLSKKEKEGAKRFLLRKLSRKALFKSEAEKLLTERGVDHEIRLEVVQLLENLSLFDDFSLIESTIRSKIQRHLGKERIKRDLYKRGVSQEVFEEHVKNVEENEGITAIDHLQTYMIKKVSKEQMGDRKERERLIRKLLRRGFELDDILNTINIFMKGAV